MSEHKLTTLKEIIAVIKAENLENFLKDFGSFLALKIIEKEMNRVMKEIVIDTENPVFRWIDDGENNIIIQVKTPKGKNA